MAGEQVPPEILIAANIYRQQDAVARDAWRNIYVAHPVSVNTISAT
jgi:hypothetical protein